MMSIHAALLVASLVCLAAALATRRRDGQTDPRPSSALALTIVGAALAVGNGVCLLPDAPRWYSIAVVVFSVAALMLLLATASRTQQRPTPRAQRHTPLYAVDSPSGETIDAEIVEDVDAGDDAFDNVVSIIREQERVVVTQPMLHAAGPAGSHTTVGHGTYVAGHLGDYLPANTSRRSRSRTRARGRSTTSATSDASAKRLRVLRAYSLDTDNRGRVTEHRS